MIGPLLRPCMMTTTTRPQSLLDESRGQRQQPQSTRGSKIGRVRRPIRGVLPADLSTQLTSSSLRNAPELRLILITTSVTEEHIERKKVCSAVSDMSDLRAVVC